MKLNHARLAVRSLRIGAMAAKHMPNDEHTALALISSGISFAMALGVSREELTTFFADALVTVEKTCRMLGMQREGMVALDTALADARANVTRKGEA